jgi:hypothetical protein
MKFNVVDNMMAALISVANEVYRVQWKAKEKKFNVMGLWKW